MRAWLATWLERIGSGIAFAVLWVADRVRKGR